MFFKKGGKKIDKLITSVIIGGALASIFGLSKKLKGEKVKKKKGFFGDLKEGFGDSMIKILNIFKKK